MLDATYWVVRGRLISSWLGEQTINPPRIDIFAKEPTRPFHSLQPKSFCLVFLWNFVIRINAPRFRLMSSALPRMIMKCTILALKDPHFPDLGYDNRVPHKEFSYQAIQVLFPDRRLWSPHLPAFHLTNSSCYHGYNLMAL